MIRHPQMKNNWIQNPSLKPVGVTLFTLFFSSMLCASTAEQVTKDGEVARLGHFPSNHFTCNKSFHYKLYFSGIKTGSLKREEHWNDQGAALKSDSYAGILGIGTRFIQTSNMVWNQEKGFVTTDFHQQVSGFKNRDMQVKITEGGSRSSMQLNDEFSQYQFDDYQILDADTISAQIRLMVINGVEQFSLARQATKGLEHYHYQLHAEKTETLTPWGEVKVIPVTQTGDESMTYWYAPKLDYQLVYAKYHSFILPGSLKLAEYEISCDQS